MTTIDLPLDSFPTVWNRALTIARRVLWIGAFVVAGVIVLEAIHLFEILAGVHPWLAWAVTALVAVPILGWSAWKMFTYMKNPVVMAPPELPPVQEGWNESQQRQFQRFAVRYLERQKVNPRLPEASRKMATDAVLRLQKSLSLTGTGTSSGITEQEEARALRSEVETAIDQVVAPLDAEAGRLIRRAAVEVAVATAISPSVLMDFLITFGRNVNLMSRLADLYYGRPGLVGTFRIGRDVLGTAAMAGALEVVSDNVTGALSEMTGAWTTRIFGPLGQGLVNGVVTLRIGAAARMRCRSIGAARARWQPWKLGDYRRVAGSVRTMVKEAVGPIFGRTEPAGDDAMDGTSEERRPWWKLRLDWLPGGTDDPDETTVEDESDDQVHSRGYDPLLDSDILDR
jgi:hypothetical protein